MSWCIISSHLSHTLALNYSPSLVVYFVKHFEFFIMCCKNCPRNSLECITKTLLTDVTLYWLCLPLLSLLPFLLVVLVFLFSLRSVNPNRALWDIVVDVDDSPVFASRWDGPCCNWNSMLLQHCLSLLYFQPLEHVYLHFSISCQLQVAIKVHQWRRLFLLLIAPVCEPLAFLRGGVLILSADILFLCGQVQEVVQCTCSGDSLTQQAKITSNFLVEGNWCFEIISNRHRCNCCFKARYFRKNALEFCRTGTLLELLERCNKCRKSGINFSTSFHYLQSSQVVWSK